jgi:hypothetical protein
MEFQIKNNDDDLENLLRRLKLFKYEFEKKTGIISDSEITFIFYFDSVLSAYISREIDGLTKMSMNVDSPEKCERFLIRLDRLIKSLKKHITKKQG